MPKPRSLRVLFFLVDATFPSNMSQTPETTRQMTARRMFPSKALRMP